MTDNTHTDNEELAKTERIILDIMQTQSTYDPAVFASDEHFAAARIARHIHQNFNLKPTPQAAVQGDRCAGCGSKSDELHLPLQHELNKERRAIQPTKSSRELEDDLFGNYCTIEMFRYNSPNEHYQHKIIGRFKSNTWVEVPIKGNPTPVIHDTHEDVINVICCGVVEEIVYRVRLADVSNIHRHTTQTTKLQAEALRRILDEKNISEVYEWGKLHEYVKVSVIKSELAQLEREHKVKGDA